jgi:anaerobic magnesium-protoporphyrin IX monomethyl ester cyclase
VDVLVGHALYMALDPKQVQKQRPYPPLGTLYVAAELRREGWRVALFDAMLAADESAFEEALDRHRPRMVVLAEDNFNFLSKMCLGRMRQAALTMTAAAAGRGLSVLVSGSDATDDPGAFLEAGASAVLLGEPEHTAVEAVEALSRRGGEVGPGYPAHDAGPNGLSGLRGLALAGPGGSVLRGPAREPERRPDVLAPPARDLVDMEAYRRIWESAHGYFSTNMASTRGCPFHCNWCAKPIWGQRYAMRSPEAVADELAELKRGLGVDHVWFADDIFGLRPDWTAAFGRAVAERRAQLPFQIQSRVDLIREDAAEGLARAGCVEVWLGVESGSQKVLDAMDKGIRVADVGPAVERLRRRGMKVGFFLQLGYPGEEFADIEATAELLREHLPDAIGVSVSYPLPGTVFYDRVAAQLGSRRHWRDSEELAMLFTGRYPTSFYRGLHDLLHKELDARHALAAARRTGADTVAAQAAVDACLEAWRRLRLAEAGQRSADPTPPAVQRSPLPVPDLSAPAN